jgi:hypothetical protein
MAMGLVAELRRLDGTTIRDLPDPSGGTFDAAGDFDRLLGDDAYPALAQIDPYAEETWDRNAMPGLLIDLTRALEDARPGPERRGLLRLRVVAELCRDDADLMFAFVGD